MLRPFPRPPVSRRQLCHACEQIFSRGLTHPAKHSFVTLNVGSRPAKIYQEAPSRSIPIRQFATARSASLRKQAEPRKQAGKPSERQESRFQSTAQRQQPDFESLNDLVAAVDRVARTFLAQQGIPSEDTSFEALRACAQADLKRIHDIERHQASSAVTTLPLLELDKTKKGGRLTSPAQHAGQPELLSAQDAVDRISTAAYAIISHPNVVITPKLLKTYVKIQSHFGRPESLPEVLELFAAKPEPRLAGDAIEYAARNPNKAANAVEKEVADAALEAAIEAKNLDAAIGIVEATYATTAHVRSKILKGVLVPGIFITLAPIAAGLLAQQFSLFQDSLDQSLATKIALAGILAYVGFMASLGVVVVATTNDQMKRVTWTPGTPLRDRWMREDERAALDKVACAFGYSEKLRWGEEVGPEWEALREYILRKSMILDSVELMEDVN
ncbi:hypothetical protein GQ53DRAFT_668204 [Thozetella sp. PMI_491]|nr:hypothetical protein GQ53DRAFT_668204 [Thozetella sp. PMI_491]